MSDLRRRVREDSGLGTYEGFHEGHPMARSVARMFGTPNDAATLASVPTADLAWRAAREQHPDDWRAIVDELSRRQAHQTSPWMLVPINGEEK